MKCPICGACNLDQEQLEEELRRCIDNLAVVETGFCPWCSDYYGEKISLAECSEQGDEHQTWIFATREFLETHRH